VAAPKWLAALLGISAYTAPTNPGAPALDSPLVEAVRRAMGGQLQPQPSTQTRWYLSDLETAERLADGGDLSMCAQLMRSACQDGTLAGVLSTRTGGLVRLPKKFRGDPEIIAALEQGHDTEDGVSVRSVFDEMFPPTELERAAIDALFLGVMVGEMVPVVGRDYPVFVRLDPEFLRYRWAENRWYFNSIAGPIPITPGDGRWILHTVGRNAPWQHGLWKAVGRAYIRKEHAALHRDNWEAKLANPARVAVAPQGASDDMKEDWLRRVMAWGVNTVFSLTPGYDVKLLESNGRGWESFTKTIAEQNQEFVIAVAGQTVTTDGGAGFSNSDIHKSIRADLIKATADGLTFTLNTQGIPAYIVKVWGEDALRRSVLVEYDVTPPKDRASEAQSLVTTATAITQLSEALAAHDRELDIDAVCARFGVPVKGDTNGDGKPDEQPGAKPKLTLVRGAA
jgi:hypothetical protein